jgi:hypothetical protein
MRLSPKQKTLLAEAFHAGREGTMIRGRGEWQTAYSLQKRGLVTCARPAWGGYVDITRKGWFVFHDIMGRAAGEPPPYLAPVAPTTKEYHEP